MWNILLENAMVADEVNDASVTDIWVSKTYFTSTNSVGHYPSL